MSFISILLLIFLIYKDNLDEQDIYGIYSFDKLIYQTGLSSSTLGYTNERNADRKYIIEAELFKIQGKDYQIIINSPLYVKEDVQYNSSLLFDEQLFQDNGIKYQFDIEDNDGNSSKYILAEHSMPC